MEALMHIANRPSTIALLALSLSYMPAEAGQLVYQPVNPAFGGNPMNYGWLLESAGIQNEHTPDRDDGALLDTLTPAERFVQSLQSRLLFAVSDQIVNAIFGENAQESGVFQFEGTTIAFVREGNNVRLTIDDGVSETEIVVPVAF
jgi:curli production assembly/transport component CsgF